MLDPRDELYAASARGAEHGAVHGPGGFRFDAAVARVFPDMIQRSVPGYGAVIALTGRLAGKYSREDSCCYDLGCSLGASTLAMRRRIRAPGCRIIAVDNSAAMLDRCRELIDADGGGDASGSGNGDAGSGKGSGKGSDTGDAANGGDEKPPVELLRADICDAPIEKASFVALNYTLQFVPLPQRDGLLKRIAAGLLPGGALLLSEKIRFSDPRMEELNRALHEQFKADSGYSRLEIARKRAALENVLIPETVDAHRERLATAGFASCDVCMQHFNFASFIAVK